MPDRLPRLAKRLLLAAGSLLLAVLAVDLAAFYLFHRRAPEWGPQRFFRHSELTGWAKIPLSAGWWYRYHDGTRYWVEQNSWGFTDREWSREKRRPRIALVGDSTTEFWEAPAEERGQVVLEELLGGAFEVLNFGVRGFGTDQTLLLLREVVLPFEPDVIVFSFCVNDLRENTLRVNKPWFELGGDGELAVRNLPVRRRPKAEERAERLPFPEPHPRLARLAEISFLARLVERRLAVAAWPEIAADLHHRPGLPFYQRRPGEAERRAEELTAALVAEMGRTARSAGAELLVVEGLYKTVLGESRQASLVAAYGDRFDFGRVTANLEAAAVAGGAGFASLPRSVAARGLDPAALVHPEDSVHLDADGIVVWAELVARRLAELGWTAPAGRAEPSLSDP